MRLLAYIRISTEEKDSPDVQREAILRYCHGQHEIIGEYVDEGITGGLPLASRPAAARMLRDAKHVGAEGIISLRLDRFSRNLADLLQFVREAQRRKLRLLFVTETFDDSPAGNLTFSILGAIAQFEREQTGRRIFEHNSWRAAKGLWPSGYAPVGLTWNRETQRLEANDRAADVVTIFRTYLEKHGNWRGTAVALNNAGIWTARGNAWTIRAVQLVIRNPIYRGCLSYGGVETPTDRIDTIVPPGMVAQAQAMSETRFGSRARSDRSYPYSGILRCGLCWRRMGPVSGRTIVGQPSARWARYVCGAKRDSCACVNRGIGQ